MYLQDAIPYAAERGYRWGSILCTAYGKKLTRSCIRGSTVETFRLWSVNSTCLWSSFEYSPIPGTKLIHFLRLNFVSIWKRNLFFVKAKESPSIWIPTSFKFHIAFPFWQMPFYLSRWYLKSRWKSGDIGGDINVAKSVARTGRRWVISIKVPIHYAGCSETRRTSKSLAIFGKTEPPWPSSAKKRSRNAPPRRGSNYCAFDG